MFRGKSQSGGSFWQAMLGGVSSSQSKAGIIITSETAMALSAVRACVTLLAESVAQLPCELYRRGANGGRERATDHPVYDLIHSQPNKKTLHLNTLNSSRACLVWRELLLDHRQGRERFPEELIPVNPKKSSS